MQLEFSESNIHQARLTLSDVASTILQLEEWNRHVHSTADYYETQTGMQLLAANCTLITAIGEGVNRVERLLPGFLSGMFPEIPWRAIVGMRNHIVHGYFDLDADLVFEAVKTDIPILSESITKAIKLLNK